MKKALSVFLILALICTLLSSAVFAAEEGENLVFNGGSLDGILSGSETERTLNGDWTQSYPVATFGGNINGDSPAKVRSVDGNAVLVLEYSGGAFASFFADLYADDQWLPEGRYELSMDLKPVGTSFRTDNIGFNLYNQYQDIRIYDGGWKDCTEQADGWYHYSRVFELNKNSVDSIQMWFNTMSADPAESALYIDNLSFRPAAEEAPVTEALTARYVVGSGEAITVSVPGAPGELTVTEKGGYVLEAGTDYTYESGTLTIANAYADGLSSGENALTLNTGSAELTLLLTIAQARPALPQSKDGFLMQETLVGGDFEIFDEGTTFGLDQAEGSWGSNTAYDDPGVIVTKDGSKVLQLRRAEKQSYSSAFVFVSPTIQAGNVVTFSFDYLLDVKDRTVYQGADINSAFVSASNMDMLRIALDDTRPAETAGDGDYQWDVSYTELENGWVHVEVPFVANTAFLSYNSIRFLLPTDQAAEGDTLYIDNVSLMLWAQAQAPEAAAGMALSFDRTQPADVYALINLHALDPISITCNGMDVNAENWSVNASKDTITLKQEYLSTLENGTQTFTVTTEGGSCDFSVEITGETERPFPVWLIVLLAVVAVGVIAAVCILARKKGKK